MSNRTKILVSTPSIVPPFAAQDARLLSSQFDVRVLPVRGIGSITQIWSALRDCDAVLVWFLGRHAFPTIVAAKLRQVPIVSVIGGFEVAWVPEIRYGIRPKSLKAAIFRWMASTSRRILSVSDFSHREAVSRLAGKENLIVTVPNAVDTSKFRMVPGVSRTGVICFGTINRRTIDLKSWPLFLDVARAMPDTQFSMIGRADDSVGRNLVSALPVNVRWLGSLAHEDIAGVLQAASVYLHLSRYESFCVSVVEAMSCGCFPVVSRFGALPEVVGELGEVVSDSNVETVVSAVRNALRRPESHRQVVREHVVKAYGIERRRELLTHHIESVLAER